MSLESILDAISSEAGREVAKIEADGERRQAEIIAEAERQAEDERLRWSHHRDQAAAREAARITNRAELDAEREVAKVREELFVASLGRLEFRLAGVTADAGYADVLRFLYEEAGSAITGGNRVVRVRPEDLDLMRGVASSEVEIRGDLDCIGGLDLETDDGRAVRNTFDSRLSAAGRQLRRLAVERLAALGGGR